jgi:hypothetical protein
MSGDRWAGVPLWKKIVAVIIVPIGGMIAAWIVSLQKLPDQPPAGDRDPD